MIFSKDRKIIYKKFFVRCIKCEREFSFVADEEEIKKLEYPLWYCSSECSRGSGFDLGEIATGNIELQGEIELVERV